MRLCRWIRRRRLVLQLAQGVLHRRQRIYDERERSRLTLGLLAAPALTLVQGQVPHAVVRRSPVIVVCQLLERCPSWKAVPFEGRRGKKKKRKKKEKTRKKCLRRRLQRLALESCFRYDVSCVLTQGSTRGGDESQQCETGDQSRSYRGRAHLERKQWIKGLERKDFTCFRNCSFILYKYIYERL